MVTANPSTRTDDELVIEAANGDQAAFAVLYERYFDNIYDFSLRIVRRADVAADVVQNAFSGAWEQLQKGNRPNYFKAWLYTISRNKALNELRHAKREVAMGDGEGDDEQVPFATIEANTLANPQAAAQDEELVRLVWGSAAALEPADYSLLDMHLRRGLSADEMSEELGIKKGAVYTRLSRLRECYHQNGGNFDKPSLKCYRATIREWCKRLVHDR